MDGLVPKIYFSVLRTHSETQGAWFFPPVNAQEDLFLLNLLLLLFMSSLRMVSLLGVRGNSKAPNEVMFCC